MFFLSKKYLSQSQNSLETTSMQPLVNFSWTIFYQNRYGFVEVNTFDAGTDGPPKQLIALLVFENKLLQSPPPPPRPKKMRSEI